MKIGLAIFASLVSLSAASADEVQLKFGTATPPMVHLNVQILAPWAKRISDEGAGKVKVTFYAGTGLVQQNNVYDRVVNDVAQIGFGLQSNVPGKFPRSDVISLPFLTDSAEVASIAAWRLYKSGLLDAEYDQVVALYINGFPPSTLHLAQKPRNLDGLDGLKIIAGSKVLAESVTRLSGAPVTFNLAETYQALQRGTADGIAMQWTAFSPFKLAEVTKFHIEASLGSSSGFVFMAKKRYEGLPKDVRAIIDAASGEAQSRRFGQFWDRIQIEERNRVKPNPAHTIVSLSPAQTASWKKRLEPVAKSWVAATPDGPKVLAAFKAELAKAEKETH